MKKTQKETVLEHLQKYGSINSLKCVLKYKILDLQSIIMNLRREGYNITDEWKKSKGQFANKYKEYYLMEEK